MEGESFFWILVGFLGCVTPRFRQSSGQGEALAHAVMIATVDDLEQRRREGGRRVGEPVPTAAHGSCGKPSARRVAHRLREVLRAGRALEDLGAGLLDDLLVAGFFERDVFRTDAELGEARSEIVQVRELGLGVVAEMAARRVDAVAELSVEAVEAGIVSEGADEEPEIPAGEGCAADDLPGVGAAKRSDTVGSGHGHVPDSSSERRREWTVAIHAWIALGSAPTTR